MLEPFSLAACALSAIAVGLSWRSASRAARSAPNLLLSEQKVIRDHVQALSRDLDAFKVEAGGTLDSHRTKMLAWREDIEAVLESVEDALERTERKRRSTAASASRIERANGAGDQAPDMTDLDQIKAVARARGIDVL